MAVTLTVVQNEIVNDSKIIAVQSPTFFIFQVDSTITNTGLSVEVAIGGYTFTAININFDGDTGTFMFEGTNILNRLLNDWADIIPSGVDYADATEMYKVYTMTINVKDGATVEATEDLEDLVLTNAARQIGENANMSDWYLGNSRVFYAQDGMDTYWYFYNLNTLEDKFLEYVAIGDTGSLEGGFWVDDNVFLTDDGYYLTY